MEKALNQDDEDESPSPAQGKTKIGEEDLMELAEKRPITGDAEC